MTDSFKNFKDSLTGSVAELGEPGYDNAMWADNFKRNPKYVVTVRNAQDIARAIKFARSEGLSIAVRGGGHGTHGASSIEGGILINTRTMNSVKVDRASMTVDIEAGARSHEIELETMKYGVSTAVGVCSSVGIVGYATGGGTGFSTGEFGLGADNILSAIVVLADGQIVEASEKSHPDLYWGGSNFGIVAELRMKLHEQRAEIYSFSYLFVITQLPAIVAVLKTWLVTQKPWECCFVVFGRGPDGNPYVIVNGWSNRDQNEAEDSFRPFLEIGPTMTTHGQISYIAWGTLFDVFCVMPGNKITSGAYIDKICIEGMQKTYETWLELTAAAPSSAVMYEFYPYGPTMANIPTDATAFAQRKTEPVVLVCMAWADEAFTNDAAITIIHKIRSAITSTSTKSVQDAIPYSNYADIWAGQNETDEFARKLFGANYPRLQEVKKKYDPDQVFNRWFGIRPAA